MDAAVGPGRMPWQTENRPNLDDLAGDGAFLKMVLQNAILEGAMRTIDALVKAGVLPNP